MRALLLSVYAALAAIAKAADYPLMQLQPRSEIPCSVAGYVACGNAYNCLPGPQDSCCDGSYPCNYPYNQCTQILGSPGCCNAGGDCAPVSVQINSVYYSASRPYSSPPYAPASPTPVYSSYYGGGGGYPSPGYSTSEGYYSDGGYSSSPRASYSYSYSDGGASYSPIPTTGPSTLPVSLPAALTSLYGGGGGGGGSGGGGGQAHPPGVGAAPERAVRNGWTWIFGVFAFVLMVFA